MILKDELGDPFSLAMFQLSQRKKHKPVVDQEKLAQLVEMDFDIIIAEMALLDTNNDAMLVSN